MSIGVHNIGQGKCVIVWILAFFLRKNDPVKVSLGVIVYLQMNLEKRAGWVCPTASLK